MAKWGGRGEELRCMAHRTIINHVRVLASTAPGVPYYKGIRYTDTSYGMSWIQKDENAPVLLLMLQPARLTQKGKTTPQKTDMPITIIVAVENLIGDTSIIRRMFEKKLR